MRQARLRQAAVGLLLVLTAAMAAGDARAAAAPQTVSVTILSVRASSEPTPYIDPVLAPIANELKARSTKYNCFRKVVSDVRNVAVGGEMQLAMIENYALQVQVEKADAGNVQLVVSWLRLDQPGKPVQSMRLTLVKGKYFLSGGWSLKDGALWGAVMAE